MSKLTNLGLPIGVVTTASGYTGSPLYDFFLDGKSTTNQQSTGDVTGVYFPESRHWSANTKNGNIAPVVNPAFGPGMLDLAKNGVNLANDFYFDSWIVNNVDYPSFTKV